MPNSATGMSFDQQKAEKFVERLVNDVGTAMRGALCYIGDKLRIFKAMATIGPVTVEELARHTGLNPRYLKEWLGAMVTASYIEYNSETRRYLLPAEHAAPLADEADDEGVTSGEGCCAETSSVFVGGPDCSLDRDCCDDAGGRSPE